jgi:hypothetical protein
LNKGLVAYYKFDGNGKNSAGGGLNLVNHGPEYQAGLSGKAASFNGQGDYFQTRDSFPIVGNHSRSIAVWLKPDDFPGNANLVGWGSFDLSRITHDNNGVGRYCGLYLTPPGSAKALLNAHWRLYSSGPDNFNFEAGSWIHLAVTYDQKTDTARFYLNGEYVGGYLALGDSTTSVKTASRPLFVGFFQPYLAPGTDVWLCTYKGLMDDLRIYNRDLTPEEVRALATNPKTQAEAARQLLQKTTAREQNWHAALVNSPY